jgi:hypothetical protein
MGMADMSIKFGIVPMLYSAPFNRSGWRHAGGVPRFYNLDTIRENDELEDPAAFLLKETSFRRTHGIFGA